MIEQKVHMANQNKLQSLQKIWNELIFMFAIYYCQKIEYKCILIIIYNPVANFGTHPLHKEICDRDVTYHLSAISS